MKLRKVVQIIERAEKKVYLVLGDKELEIAGLTGVRKG